MSTVLITCNTITVYAVAFRNGGIINNHFSALISYVHKLHSSSHVPIAKIINQVRAFTGTRFYMNYIKSGIYI